MTEMMELRRHRDEVFARPFADRLTDKSRSGVVVVANREPYSHQKGADGTVSIERPASGLVTGIEPILRQSAGTWVAHASGSADRETSGRDGRLRVPPGRSEYTLQRVFVPSGEFEKFYGGFANEALWPLCHIAHTRPCFRQADWAAYQSVNCRFADAAIAAAARDALILVQDYHFALVPSLLRQRMPDLVTSLFWHIPWPNYEMFDICPWKREILRGMTAADVLGFHTKQHCLNFIETAEHLLGCSVDYEEMTITSGGHRSLVRPYPISIEWPFPSASREEGKKLRASLGIGPDAHVSIGVDRADYTKGLLERVAAVELLLERNAGLRGNYVLVQIASPTRSALPAYRDLAQQLIDEVARVNARFATDSWKPIVLEMRTVSQEDVRVFYAMADSALVTPLHDGMNLVAKEYAASCEDGNGVLVLSAFAGAAKELESALIVNPYDTEEVANAILRAVRMPVTERVVRMRAMRAQIASHSIRDWSAKILRDMRDIRKSRVTFRRARFSEQAAASREAMAG